VYCLCVNVYCHRVSTQLQLTNISVSISTALAKVFFAGRIPPPRIKRSVKNWRTTSLWTLLEPEDRDTTFHRNGRNSWPVDSVTSQAFKHYISLMIDSVLNYKLLSLQFIYRQSILSSHMCLDLAVYIGLGLPYVFISSP
jgi:hypothetical protein